MDSIKIIPEKLNDFLSKSSKNKIYAILFIIGIIGILLIFISELPVKNEKNIDVLKKNTIDYTREKELEDKLGRIVSRIDGAGKTTVMLTIDSSPKYYYAKETSKSIETDSAESEEKYVITENDGEEDPIIIRVEEADIRGVAVICEGGSSAIVKEKITETVCAVLGIKVNQVSVAKMA